MGKYLYPKSSGGLGSRDLKCFNQSPLAKQGWKIITKPNSLLEKVLISKYFHHSSFFEATSKKNVSYMWRSLIWEKELLTKGTGWRVGNGESIWIDSDQWIPLNMGLNVKRRGDVNSALYVAELIEAGGHWKEVLIRDLFEEEEANRILDIPLP